MDNAPVEIFLAGVQMVAKPFWGSKASSDLQNRAWRSTQSFEQRIMLHDVHLHLLAPLGSNVTTYSCRRKEGLILVQRTPSWVSKMSSVGRVVPDNLCASSSVERLVNSGNDVIGLRRIRSMRRRFVYQCFCRTVDVLEGVQLLRISKILFTLTRRVSLLCKVCQVT